MAGNASARASSFLCVWRRRVTKSALVSRTRSSRDSSASTFANFGFKRDTRGIKLLVPLWFGSTLRSKPRIQANFRTAAPVVPATKTN